MRHATAHLEDVFLQVGSSSQHPAKEEQPSNEQGLRNGYVIRSGHQVPDANGIKERIEYQTSPDELEAKPRRTRETVLLRVHERSTHREVNHLYFSAKMS